MKKTILGTKRKLGIGCAALVLFGAVAFAQAPPPPPILPPQELDRLVSRIALYPDSLLAQILAGATYTDEIPPASAWANQHSYLHGDALANAINEHHLPWDPSVQTLLPFPSVLDMMARDMAWTSQLGNAFMAQQQVVVTPGPYIAIAAVNPGLYYVPLYDPLVVFAPPRPGIFIGGAIRFGSGITIGAAFAPWGWGHASFGWNTHTVIINNHPWARTWETRRTYVQPYTVQRYAPERRIEHHEVREHERREERR